MGGFKVKLSRQKRTSTESVMENNNKRIGIVGGSGYSGAELLRILIRHPGVQVDVVTSRGQTGQPIAEYFPSLRGALDLSFSDPAKVDLSCCELVFFATPNGTAMQQVPELLNQGVKVIDLAADFRFPDAGLWSRWYAMEHACPELLEEAVYGLPEVNREAIRKARLIANPGCYPTAVSLGFLPLLEAGVIDSRHLIADVKSGASGAGRKLATGLLYAEVSESMSAYSVSGHRHQPEIVSLLETVTGHSIGLTFVPHLTPMIRGIHATLYATLTAPGADIQGIFEDRFAQEVFVDVMPPGSHPQTQSVRGANSCRISWHRPDDGDTLVILVVEDNLVKGAAGQAVQCMNLMLGLDEVAGLDGIGF